MGLIIRIFQTPESFTEEFYKVFCVNSLKKKEKKNNF